MGTDRFLHKDVRQVEREVHGRDEGDGPSAVVEGEGRQVRFGQGGNLSGLANSSTPGHIGYGDTHQAFFEQRQVGTPAGERLAQGQGRRGH